MTGAEPTVAIFTTVPVGGAPSGRLLDRDAVPAERLREVGGRAQLRVVDVAAVGAHVAAERERRRDRDLDRGEVVLPPLRPPVALERSGVADDRSLDARDAGVGDLLRERVQRCGCELGVAVPDEPQVAVDHAVDGRGASHRARRGSPGRDRPSRAAPSTAAASRSRRARASPSRGAGTRTRRRRRSSPTSVGRRSARRSDAATRAGPGARPGSSGRRR